MRCYLEYFILKEYRRQGKREEYRMLKKQLVSLLNEQGWATLAAKILTEDSDFLSEHAKDDSSGLSLDLQLEELAMSRGKEAVAAREAKLKYASENNNDEKNAAGADRGIRENEAVQSAKGERTADGGGTVRQEPCGNTRLHHDWGETRPGSSVPPWGPAAGSRLLRCVAQRGKLEAGHRCKIDRESGGDRPLSGKEARVQRGHIHQAGSRSDCRID